MYTTTLYRCTYLLLNCCLLFERSEFLISTWVTPQYRATSKKKICACVRLILVLVGGRQTAIVVARYDSMIPGTYYVPDTYVPGISRQKSIRTYVVVRLTKRNSSCRYNERQLIDVTVVRRVRPRAERSCDCEGQRRWKRAGRTLSCY